jgi:hypothetical protein
MKILAQAFALSVLVLAVGCPPPSEPVISIDGLEGGKLTSGIDAPAVATEAAAIGSLTATTASVETTTTTTLDAQASTLGEATATSLETATLTVTDAADVGELFVEAVTADTVTTDSVGTGIVVAGALRLQTTGALDDGSLIGHVVGVTETVGGSYDNVDRACFNAFVGSHVCGEVDVLHFLRSANFRPQVESLTAAALDGASFATVTHAVVGFDGANQPIVADDCDSWRQISNAGEPPGLHARHIITIEPIGSSFVGRVSTSNSCSLDDLRILCCGQ